MNVLLAILFALMSMVLVRLGASLFPDFQHYSGPQQVFITLSAAMWMVVLMRLVLRLGSPRRRS